MISMFTLQKTKNKTIGLHSTNKYGKMLVLTDNFSNHLEVFR